MQPLDEDWNLLLGLLPPQWQQQSVLTGACERLRGFSTTSDLLRTLLLHIGKGYSLRETVVRAKAAGIAEISDVALMKRLQKAEAWLRGLCLGLLEESGLEMPAEAHGFNVRALDGTVVKEPGRSGSLWRIHYSVRIPSLVCDHFQLTPTKGAETGEKLGLFDEDGSRFGLAEQIGKLKQTGTQQEWPVWVHGSKGSIPGRLCAIRKSEEAAAQARRRIERKSQQGGPKPRAETLQYACLRDGVHHSTGESLPYVGGAGMVSCGLANRIGVRASRDAARTRLLAQAR